jgi:subtilisin family serine protease
MKKSILTAALLSATLLLFGQEKNIQSFKPEQINWYNKDIKTDKTLGTSVDKTYSTLLPGLTPRKTVVVAVIDGGVDIHHEDLKGKIWVNADENPGNNIDDDKNGYVDDIHGWNFIGNKAGENIKYENYEFTRLLRQENYENYKKAKEEYEKEYSKRMKEKNDLDRFEEVYNKAKSIILENAGINVSSKGDLEKVTSGKPEVKWAKDFLSKRYKMGFTEEVLNQFRKQNDEYLRYYLNKDLNARNLIGDDPSNLDDNNYGNNDVKGPRSEHGTAVAGLIAANRNNGIGIDGVASNVLIMSIRTTPSGDERDKDVALGIIYAVDNGADIINMSFGKQFSPQKEMVDKAVKYAESKGVLMVHSSGNSGENIDVVESFPCPVYKDGKKATNWITIGATEKELSKKVPAVFSNYGAKNVDLFAPGVDIVSLDTSSTYSMHSGTSFSAPVVTGVAALLLSYYPDLKPEQVIEILKESSYKVMKPKMVLVPTLESEKRPKTSFKQLSQSGGVVNAYNAMELAKNKYAR